MSLPNHFDLVATDGPARTGRLTTPHGVVRTPAFMPVGTAGAMKGMHWREVRDAGADIVLGNTYHLMLRPGAERIAALGGLQTFTGWNGPMLTDSGGFQVMSLAQLRKVSEGGVTFRSHIDGASLELSPERAIEVQRLLGSDIAMQLDECVRLPAERGDIERAMQLSLRWARAQQACVREPHRRDTCCSASLRAVTYRSCAAPARAAWSRSAFTATRSAVLRSANRRR